MNARRMWKILLLLTVTMLTGCMDWNNRNGDPYVKPGEKGTPSDRTGGARSGLFRPLQKELRRAVLLSGNYEALEILKGNGPSCDGSFVALQLDFATAEGGELALG
jgi:hypothetical protein